MSTRRPAAPGTVGTVILGSVALAASIPLLLLPTAGGWSVSDMIRLQADHLLAPVADGELSRVLSRHWNTALNVALVVLLIVLPVRRLRHRASVAFEKASRRQERLRERRRRIRGRGDSSEGSDSAGIAMHGTGDEEHLPVPESLARGLDVPGMHGEADVLHRTPDQLRALAAQHRMPWRPEYATPGGARVLLELLALRGAGIGGPGTASATEPDSEPAPDPDSEPAPDPDSRSGAGPGTEPPGAPDRSTVADPRSALLASSATAMAAALAARRTGPGTSSDAPTPSASPSASASAGTVEPETGADAEPGTSSLGSVYTSTTLYESSSYSVTGTPGADADETEDER